MRKSTRVSTLKKMRTAPPRTSSFPPYSLSLIEQWTDNGVDLLALSVPMLPSVNEKTRKTATTVYTSAEYRKRERITAEAISDQVDAAGWHVTKDDRYLAEFHFPFEEELRRDLDGSIKPILDAMQQMEPTLAELRQMHDPTLLALWQTQQPVSITKTGKVRVPRPTTYRQWKSVVSTSVYTAWIKAHPPAIRNDNQVVDIEVVKHVKQPPDTPALIFLFRLSAKAWKEIEPFYHSALHQARGFILARRFLFPTHL